MPNWNKNLKELLIQKEVALELDLTDQEVRESLRHSGKHLSMDAPLATDEDNTNVRLYA